MMNLDDATMGDGSVVLFFWMDSFGHVKTIETKEMCNDGDGQGSF